MNKYSYNYFKNFNSHQIMNEIIFFRVLKLEYILNLFLIIRVKMIMITMKIAIISIVIQKLLII